LIWRPLQSKVFLNPKKCNLKLYKKLLNLFTIGSLLFKLVKLQFDALRGVGKDGWMATKPCNHSSV